MSNLFQKPFQKLFDQLSARASERCSSAIYNAISPFTPAEKRDVVVDAAIKAMNSTFEEFRVEAAKALKNVVIKPQTNA